MDTLAKRLALTLRALRGDDRQSEFAKKLGIAQSTLNRLESAQQNITITTLEKLTRRLGRPVGDLFLSDEQIRLQRFKSGAEKMVEIREEAEREVARLKKRRPKDSTLHAELDKSLADFLSSLKPTGKKRGR